MSKANLANAILAAPLSDTATSATLVSGYGSIMPPVPFKMTLTPFGQLSTKGNSEIILVTARTGEVLTIERAKGGTTAKTFEAGDIISNGIYIENSTAVGDIFMSLRATPAAGRLFMAGGTFAKADYPLLYKLVQDSPAYGTTGGSSGSETFTLADMRERMPFGKSDNVPFTTLGGKAGSSNHLLTVAEMPIHSHLMPALTAIQTNSSTGRRIQFSGADNTLTSPTSNGTYSLRMAEGQQNVPIIPTENAGGGNAHDIMNPYILVNYEVIAG